MQKALLYKFLVIGGLAIVLLVPLTMIGSIIDERAEYRDQVVRNIADTWVGSQKVTGLMLVAPYETIEFEEVQEYKNSEVRYRQEKITHKHEKYYLPKTLQINGELVPQDRYRGIYKISGYTSSIQMNGTFDLPTFEEKENVVWKAPFLVLGVRDVRGINRSIRLSVNGQNYPFKPSTNFAKMSQGVHAVLDQEVLKQKTLSFDASLELLGMEELVFQPLGEFTQVNLTSPWPHPSFMGRYLPKTREISADGFTATWETSYFASNMIQQLRDCVGSGPCSPFENNYLGVSLHQGVDVYVQSDRSVKYAILFVGLTFIAFFLFEILKGLKIHAVQYGLVGVSLSLFYLLLISLSEHIAFTIAYLIASAACIGLLGFYVCYVLKSLIRGGIFAAVLVGLYSALYMLIRSEDYALLMGTFLLFGGVAFVMAITRKIDWYQVALDRKKDEALVTEGEN